MAPNDEIFKRLWSREELVLAFNLYLKLPFGKLHSNTSEIIHLAKLIKRTPSSVAMRLCNFASVDPYHINRGIKGLKGGFRQVQPIWDEFKSNQEDLLFLSEQILAKFEGKSIEDKFISELSEVEKMKGEEKTREVKQRINQYIFRQMVLSNYMSKCALTGINLPDLLVASHIVPWSQNDQERLNPENGLCLSSLYDKAFDKGLLSINLNYKVILSKKLKEEIKEPYYQSFFAPIENTSMRLPHKYLPNKSFLEFHLKNIFQH
jgi:putative restriction endonuclease